MTQLAYGEIVVFLPAAERLVLRIQPEKTVSQAVEAVGTVRADLKDKLGAMAVSNVLGESVEGGSKISSLPFLSLCLGIDILSWCDTDPT